MDVVLPDLEQAFERFILFVCFVQKQERDSSEEIDSAVAHVTEHHSELEREGDDRENGRVHLLISRHAIRVHDLLERSREVVQLEICRRCQIMFLRS